MSLPQETVDINQKFDFTDIKYYSHHRSKSKTID